MPINALAFNQDKTEQYAVEKTDSFISRNIEDLIEDSKELNTLIENVTELKSNTGEILEVPVYEIDTTEITQQFSQDEDLKSVTYAIDTSDAISVASATGSTNRTEWDSTSSVKAYTTIYYKSSGNPAYYLLTSVTGGYTIGDPQVKVKSQKVVMGCSDYVTVQSLTKTPTLSSWSYATSFKTSVLYSQMLLGSNYYLTLQQVSGGSTWTLQITNNL